MRISKISAQQIVEEIGDLVHQNINLMDENGSIIASNDPARIGTFHEGAYRIIRDHLPELYIDTSMEKTLGKVRRGINLPIKVDGKVEGVIGITGSYEEVIHYGQIVQRMAAILIKERMRLDEARYDMRVKSRFLEDWILTDNRTSQRSLAERGIALDIDIRQPRRCMVLSVRDLNFYIKTLEGQEFMEKLEGEINQAVKQYPGTIIMRNAGRQILLLNRRDTPELMNIARSLIARIRDKYNVAMMAGIDGEADDLHIAYTQANRAWQVAPRYKSDVVNYQDLNIELIFDHIPPQEKLQYLHKIFVGWDAGKLREYAAMLDAYFAAEGSLGAAADALYIHKNTLQYRLRQLAEVTGLDVRKPSNAPVLYVALQFLRDLEAENQL